MIKMPTKQLPEGVDIEALERLMQISGRKAITRDWGHMKNFVWLKDKRKYEEYHKGRGLATSIAQFGPEDHITVFINSSEPLVGVTRANREDTYPERGDGWIAKGRSGAIYHFEHPESGESVEYKIQTVRPKRILTAKQRMALQRKKSQKPKAHRG